MRNTVIATLAAASLLLAACGEDNTAGQDAVAVGGTFTFYAPGGQTKVTYPQNERKPVKNFSGESLMDPEKTISLDDYKGQIVVLNAWGQWCAPCRATLSQTTELATPASTIHRLKLRLLWVGSPRRLFPPPSCLTGSTAQQLCL